MEQRGVCGWCVLSDKLAAVLDDGTGRIRPELLPFRDRMVAMPRPRTGILWLNKPHVPPLLHAIATGQVPLTHDGIASLTPANSASYVRRLLVAVGTLPALPTEAQWLTRERDAVARARAARVRAPASDSGAFRPCASRQTKLTWVEKIGSSAPVSRSSA